MSNPPTNAANEARFAARVQRIEAQNRTSVRRQRVRTAPNVGSLLIGPMMLVFVMAAGTIYAWDVMERPTDNPFEVAITFTSGVLEN